MAVNLGIAHAGALYEHNRSQGNHLADGAKDIKDIGATSIKLFMGGNYNAGAVNGTALYPMQDTRGWSDTTAANLTELAQTTEYASVIGDTDFTKVFLNVWPLTGFTETDAWKGDLTTGLGLASFHTLLQNEYNEIKALAEYLMATYAGEGRTFYLSTWEGDWAYLAGTDTTITVRPSYLDGRMVVWLQNRIRAVEDAKRGQTETGVTVKSVVECNRVYDAYHKASVDRLVTKVLPRISPDVVSYSAYETLTQYGANYTEWAAYVSQNFPRAIQQIRAACPQSEVIVGEFGYPEEELAYNTATMLAHTLETFEDAGINDAIFWGMWDNEQSGGDYRGFWLIDDAGALSEQGTYINSLLGGSF